MRLTLRTLLAFLDNTLEEKDADALRPKVEESEFAKLITARIDSSLKQPRLSAPPLDEKGVGLDANDISQYLDNTLPAEKVPELEQFLLHSDMQLAEVAACHQILSAALEQEVSIPAELRHRIRCLGSPRELAKGSYADAEVSSWLKESDSSAKASRNVGGTPISSASSAESSLVNQPSATTQAGMMQSLNSNNFAKPTTHFEAVSSDPLRGPIADWTTTLSSADDEPAFSSRLLKIAIGLTLLGILLAATMQALGPINRLTELWRGKIGANTNDQESSPPLATSIEDPSGSAKSSISKSKSLSNNAVDRDSSSTDQDSADKPSSGSETDTQVASKNPDDSDTQDLEGNMKTPNNAGESVALSNATSIPNNSPVSSDGKENSSKQNPTQSRFVARWLPSPETQNSPLIFAVNPERNQIFRLLEAIDLPADTQIIVPPASRPSITLRDAVAWTSYGAMDYRLRNAIADSSASAIEVVQGRGVLQDVTPESNASAANSTSSETAPSLAKIQLRNGSHIVSLTWLQPNSIVSVEAVPTFIEPPAEPASASNNLKGSTEFKIVVLQGSVEFQMTSPDSNNSSDAAANPNANKEETQGVGTNSTRVIMSVGQGWLRDTAGNWQAVQIDATPAWIDAAAERPIDRQAINDMLGLIPGGERANIVARELLANRRPEIAALACQTLLLADDFSFLAGPNGFLNNDRFRSHWFPIVEAVRQRAASNPISFAALQSSLTSQDVQRGNLLFQTLIGSPAIEISSGEGEKLVNLLESEFMDERVLAIYQLKRIVGKDLGYQADRPSKGTVQDWKRLLRTGGLRP
jgi:hypothetical protein